MKKTSIKTKLLLLAVILVPMFAPFVEAGQMKPTEQLTFAKMVEAAYEVLTLTPARPALKVVPGRKKSPGSRSKHENDQRDDNNNKP